MNNNAGHHGRRKILNLHCLGCPKTVKKPRNLGGKIPNRIYLEFIFEADILAEKLKVNKNWQKRSLLLQYSFAQKAHSFYETSITF